MISFQTKVFSGCPVLASGLLTPLSSVKLIRQDFWHTTMHWFSTVKSWMVVITMLVIAQRLDTHTVGSKHRCAIP